MTIRSTVCLAALTLLGCGGAQGPSSSTGNANSDCPYTVGDSCVDENAMAACEAAAAECPGAVQTLETCPLQFSCGAAGDGDTSVGNDGDTSVSNDQACEGYNLGDACITEDNFAQCQAMSAQCPGEVVAMESCPLQFACP